MSAIVRPAEPERIPAGPSPAGWSLLGTAGRCVALWGFERPEEDLDAVPQRPEDVVDPDTTRIAPNQLHRDLHPPFLRGIMAHDALAQTWRRHQAVLEGTDPDRWATWQYVVAYDLVYAAASEPATVEDAERLEAAARAAGAWVMEAPPRTRMDRLDRAVTRTRPDLAGVVESITDWHRTRWLPEQRPHVVAVEEPLRLWLDPAKQVDEAPVSDPMGRYGVVPAPADEALRLRLYRALRGPDWRAALGFLADLGPPWLVSSRLDMRYRADDAHWIEDLKSGYNAGKASEHRAYQNSGQIIAIDLYGRTHIPGYRGFVLEYLPWIGKPSVKGADVAETHRRALAWTLQERYLRLFRHVGLPLSRWERVFDIQGCRTVYDDPCPFYHRCRE